MSASTVFCLLDTRLRPVTKVRPPMSLFTLPGADKDWLMGDWSQTPSPSPPQQYRQCHQQLQQDLSLGVAGEGRELSRLLRMDGQPRNPNKLWLWRRKRTY